MGEAEQASVLPAALYTSAIVAQVSGYLPMLGFQSSTIQDVVVLACHGGWRVCSASACNPHRQGCQCMHICLCGHPPKMDEYPLLLSEEQSVELYNSGMRHLRLYSYLHRESAKRTGTEAMRNCWLLQPKHHFFYHMCRDCKEQRLNPATIPCWRQRAGSDT